MFIKLKILIEVGKNINTEVDKNYTFILEHYFINKLRFLF
jgi:hypothetical protein